MLICFQLSKKGGLQMKQTRGMLQLSFLWHVISKCKYFYVILLLSTRDVSLQVSSGEPLRSVSLEKMEGLHGGLYAIVPH